MPSCAFVQWGNYRTLQMSQKTKHHSFLCFEGVRFHTNTLCNHQEAIVTHFVPPYLMILIQNAIM